MLERPDRAKIHYELRGEGPLVFFATYWSWSPGVYEELFEDLAADHCVLTYHLRGTGDSGRDGPHDMDTDLGDIESLPEETGGPGVAFGLADSSHRALKIAARRPDLVSEVAAFGPPLPQVEFGSSEALVGSESVTRAFREMVSRDYRGAIRSMATAVNPQMDEAAVQQLVADHVAFSPREAALGRTQAWLEDDPLPEAIALGDRLSVLISERGTGNVWFPEPPELERLTAAALPEARIVHLEDGPTSRPDLTAAAIREMTARVKARLRHA